MTSQGSVFLAEVFVTLKRLVNDPEGIEIRNGLHNLGYDGVEDVRSGKYFQVRVQAGDRDEALAKVTEMSERLLCNTVIEEFRLEIHQASEVH